MDCNNYSFSGQMDIFDFLEDKNKVKEFNPLKALALCGTGIPGRMKSIADYFLENHNLREKVAFLKNEYGTGGFGSSVKKPCYIHGMCTAFIYRRRNIREKGSGDYGDLQKCEIVVLD